MLQQNDNFSTKLIGNMGELRIAYEFTKRGYIVSIPYGDIARYDLVVDSGKKIYRIQVKTILTKTSKENYYTIKNFSTSFRNSNIRKQYNDSEIDFVCVYLNDINKCLAIPIHYFTTSTMTIRDDFNFPLNGQEKNVNFVSDFRFDLFFPSLIVK